MPDALTEAEWRAFLDAVREKPLYCEYALGA
jgi:hypothetical protein